MSETGNPATGRPSGGTNEPVDGGVLPGEQPLAEGERAISAPSGGPPTESASRAAEGGAMPADQTAEAPGSAGQPNRAGSVTPGEGGQDRAGGVSGSADATSS